MIQSIQNIFTEDKPEVNFLIEDCRAAFNCRNVAENDNYSVGSTYFVPINVKANSGIEKLAQDIFQYHVNTRGLQYDEKSSGSEWWTQVIDSRDDIGFHWDRDYGMEERNGSCMYPNLATVTYLSNFGGPTIVMERIGDLSTDADISCNFGRCFLSAPKFGKHFSFPGNLLHAAPSDLLYHPDSDSSEENDSDESSVQQPSAEKHPVRITFLVNVWINHIPENCSRYDPPKESAVHDYSSLLSNLRNDSLSDSSFSSISYTLDSPFLSQITFPAEGRERMKWTLNHGDETYQVSMPSLSSEEVGDVMEKARANVMVLQFAGSGINISKLESGEDIDDDDEEDEDDDEEEEDDDDDEKGHNEYGGESKTRTEVRTGATMKSDCGRDGNKRKATEPNALERTKRR